MTKKTGFLCGMGAGLMAGVAAGSVMGRTSRKSQLGKSVRKLGDAVEKAVDDIAASIN